MTHETDTVSKHGTLARRTLGAYATVGYIYLLVPILLIVLFSFNSNPTGAFPFTGFTLQWYKDVFADPVIQTAFVNSMKVAALVTLVSTVVGTAAAFPLVRARIRFRGGVRVFLTLPIMIPALLIGVALLILFAGVMHIPLSMTTVVVGQSIAITPFTVLLVSAQLQGFDAHLEHAASDLGANTWRRLRLVVLPLIMPAIIASMCFSFVVSIDEFIITLFMIGPGDYTLPIYIFTQIRQGITPAVNAVVAMMLVGTLLLLALGTVLPRLLRRALRTDAESLLDDLDTGSELPGDLEATIEAVRTRAPR